MKRAGVVLAVLLSSTGMAEGSDWQVVGQSAKDNAIWLLDRESVVTANGKAGAWVKTIYTQPQMTPAGKWYTSQVIVLNFDCLSRMFRTREVHLYSDAEQIDGGHIEAPWVLIVPDTMVDALSRAVCPG